MTHSVKGRSPFDFCTFRLLDFSTFRRFALAGAESEGLYACTVVVAQGATLDLNGLNVYHRSLQQDEGGAIELNDGTLQQVGLDAEPDGDVDLADFARFQVCFSGPSDAPGYSEPSWQCVQTFDQDCDGDVDSQDCGVLVGGLDGP